MFSFSLIPCTLALLKTSTVGPWSWSCWTLRYWTGAAWLAKAAEKHSPPLKCTARWLPSLQSYDTSATLHGDKKLSYKYFSRSPQSQQKIWPFLVSSGAAPRGDCGEQSFPLISKVIFVSSKTDEKILGVWGVASPTIPEFQAEFVTSVFKDWDLTYILSNSSSFSARSCP